MVGTPYTATSGGGMINIYYVQLKKYARMYQPQPVAMGIFRTGLFLFRHIDFTK